MTNQYRKKPVVIEAIQYDGDNWDDIGVWTDFRAKHWRSSNVMAIETLEGTMTANVGDWIIKGVAGEFYPCKPDIFEATYEPTTNCSQSEQTFTVKKGKWGSWSGDIWEVNNKHGELVGHITEFGFKLYDQPVWGTPTDLRQLADLVEDTLEGGE